MLNDNLAMKKGKTGVTKKFKLPSKTGNYRVKIPSFFLRCGAS